MNGWESGVLEKAISENDGCKCGCGCGQEQMEQCFGSANVNKDDDKDWASCSATSTRDNDAAGVLDALPGCNPLQYGPASATAASGPGCTAAPAPAASGNSSVPASASATPILSTLLSAIMPTGSYTAISPSAFPTFKAKTPQDEADAGADAQASAYDAVKPTPTAASEPEESSPKTATPADPNASSTKCTSKPVVYKTVTQTATITVGGAKPSGGY